MVHPLQQLTKLATTIIGGHELMIKNALLFTTVSLWPNGLRRWALHEVVSGSNPGFTRFAYFSCPFLAVLVLPFAKTVLS